MTTTDAEIVALARAYAEAWVEEARSGLPLDWWERHAVELPRQGSGTALSWDPTPLAEAV